MSTASLMMQLINRIRHFFARNFLVINTFAVFVYVWTVIPFYRLPYEVPDYYKYYGFALEGLPAKDGFSSLFIAISQYLITHFSLIHWGSLFLLSTSLWVINYSFYRVNNQSLNRYLFLLFSYSLGSWFYLYGKLFYEFPFIAMTFAILLFFAKDFINYSYTPNPKTNKLLYLCFLLAGFCLSWKAHAIFPVLGLFGLILLNSSILRYIYPKKIFGLGIFFFIGFSIGNFNVWVDFFATIDGIRGYKTSSNVMDYVFDDHKVAWDHVNLLSFNSAIYCIPSLLFIVFIAPLFVVRGRYIVLFNLLVCLFFLGVMGAFLSGLTWQGFPFSLYLVGLIFYILSNIGTIKIFSRFSLLFLFFIGLQYFYLLHDYLPIQKKWLNATNIAIEQLQQNEQQILGHVKELIKKNGSFYRIDLRLKRNWPHNFNNALQQQNPEGWNPIFKNECFAPCVPTYQIVIEPLALLGVRSYQGINKPEVEIIRTDSYQITLKPFDASFIDQEIHLLK